MDVFRYNYILYLSTKCRCDFDRSFLLPKDDDDQVVLRRKTKTDCQWRSRSNGSRRGDQSRRRPIECFPNRNYAHHMDVFCATTLSTVTTKLFVNVEADCSSRTRRLVNVVEHVVGATSLYPFDPGSDVVECCFDSPKEWILLDFFDDPSSLEATACRRASQGTGRTKACRRRWRRRASQGTGKGYSEGGNSAFVRSLYYSSPDDENPPSKPIARQFDTSRVGGSFHSHMFAMNFGLVAFEYTGQPLCHASKSISPFASRL